jgi:hypothetical protein
MGSAAADGYFAAGTRLKPSVLGLGPGLDVLASPSSDWTDTELDFTCTMGVAEDGVTRCLPPLALPVLYGDPSCSSPRALSLLPRSCNADTPTFVTGAPYLGDGCAGQLRNGYRVVRELPLSGELYMDAGGACEPYVPLAKLDVVYELEPVPPETFVALTLGHRPRAPGLEAYVREGADGSWQIMGFFDPSRGARCDRSTSIEATKHRCLPPVAATQLFSDALCTMGGALAAAPDDCVEPPTLIARSTLDQTTCPPTIKGDFFEIGDTLETSLDYRLSGEGCVENPMGPALVHLEGAPFDPSTLPELEELELGMGPVRGRFDGFGGRPYRPVPYGSALVNAETGESCWPLLFADNALRCVPASYHQISSDWILYADPNCTAARMYPSPVVADCAGEPAPPAAVAIGEGNTCGPYAVQEIVTIGAAVTPTQLYQRGFDGGCTPVAAGAWADDRLLELGDALAPELFPELTLELRE